LILMTILMSKTISSSNSLEIQALTRFKLKLKKLMSLLYAEFSASYNYSVRMVMFL
jgi:hypothetical protein